MNSQEKFPYGSNTLMTPEEAEALWPTPDAEEVRDLLQEGNNPDYAKTMQDLAIHGIVRVNKQTNDTETN